MRNIKTKAIILGHRDFLESDKLVTFYSEELGKIRVIAKGARKIKSKFTGHLETLSSADVTLYQSPKNLILTEISTIKNPLKTRDEFDTVASAVKIAQITNEMLYESQTIENLTELITQTLEHLLKTKKHHLLVISYIVKLLDNCGLVPDFKETSHSLEHKYRKFFQFLRKSELKEIENITINNQEHQHIEDYLSSLLPSPSFRLSLQ